MITIRIKCWRFSDARRWTIENWKDYEVYLRSQNIPVPLRSYGLYLSDEMSDDIQHVSSEDFEIKQVPALFQLFAGKVAWKFV